MGSGECNKRGREGGRGTGILKDDLLESLESLVEYTVEISSIPFFVCLFFKVMTSLLATLLPR